MISQGMVAAAVAVVVLVLAIAVVVALAFPVPCAVVVGWFSEKDHRQSGCVFLHQIHFQWVFPFGER